MKALDIGSLGVAGLVPAAHAGVVPSAEVALSGVPLWTHAQSLLGHIQAGFSGEGSGGLNLGL